jgi:hypothetical protein
VGPLIALENKDCLTGEFAAWRAVVQLLVEQAADADLAVAAPEVVALGVTTVAVLRHSLQVLQSMPQGASFMGVSLSEAVSP